MEQPQDEGVVVQDAPSIERVTTLSAAVAALAGCGGGGGAEAPAPAPSPAPPPPAAGVTSAQAARFLAHATLAPTDETIDVVRTLGYDAWLTQEFARAPSSGNWDWLVAHGYDVDPDSKDLPIGFDNTTWQRLLSAPDSLRQRMALALSEFFVVGLGGVTLPFKQFALAAWWDLLASNAFGTYRALLEAVTLNAAMGVYLATHGNQKEDPATGRLPDENYAREVLQLFSIGLVELNADGTTKLANGQPIETYDQDTITNLARVFTGWHIDGTRNDTVPELVRRPMVLASPYHSTLAATFLGVTVPANTDGTTALRTALDTIAAHPNVGPFFGRQLIQRLVTSNPSPAYVARVAAAFADNGAGVRGDLQAVIRAVLLDDEARGDAGLSGATFGKLREPMLRFIQWARVFKVGSVSGTWLLGDLSDAATRLGQSPLRSSSVFNYFRPGYVPPNTAIAAQSLVAPELQITHETSVAGYLNSMQAAVGGGIPDLQPDYSAELALVDDVTALVDRIDRLLTANQLSSATKTTIRDALTSISAATAAGRNNRVWAAVLLVLASPEYLVQK